jgi:hypothetical protein
VNRIRIDEEIHVASLRLYLAELRLLHFRRAGGGTLAGRELVDPLWQGIVRWATVEQPALASARMRQILRERISRHPDAARLQREFDALEEEVGDFPPQPPRAA